MTNCTDTFAGLAGLTTGKSLRLRASVPAWIGAAMGVEATRLSLAVRWKGC